jgi:hypothetical protein
MGSARTGTPHLFSAVIAFGRCCDDLDGWRGMDAIHLERTRPCVDCAQTISAQRPGHGLSTEQLRVRGGLAALR